MNTVGSYTGDKRIRLMYKGKRIIAVVPAYNEAAKIGRVIERTGFSVVDRLLVIDDGKVAEFGTHEELLKRKGIYANLVDMQSKLSALRAVDG